MQSQQKRVKWSRGETAEAIEERTETGITQASVELMENCIPDIYGNISRRPALKILPLSEDIGNNWGAFTYDPDMQIIPFYITENDYILIAIHGNNTLVETMRIKNNKIVYKTDILSSLIVSTMFHEDLINGTISHHPVSFAQQNNYLLIATERYIYKLQVSLGNNDDSYTISITTWNFVAGWYAPNGASSKKVDNTTQVIASGVTVTLTDLEFNHNGDGFSQYIATLSDGSSTAYSAIDTNLSNTTQNMEAINAAIPLGSIVQFLEIGGYMRVEGFSGNNGKINMWGSLLTPAVDDTAKDKSVVVEYGYTRMYPTQLDILLGNFYPHPTQLLFLDQRLWAGDWLYGMGTESTGSYALTVGSQIAKYNDFKNDYNQDNEAITLDILTQYREKILHLVDYNGLKIMTDSYEYSYESGAVVKQSGNGSFRDCKPIVFESLCLYCDSTGHQIKAMQYEFQSNIFNSSTVNTVAPHDLVWYPFCMAGYEDKINSTGKYIFLVNKNEEGHPRIAVCNFVPGNQANIWSRWSVAQTVKTRYREDLTITPSTFITNNNTPLIQSVINLKNGLLFFVNVSRQDLGYYPTDVYCNHIQPAILDFDGNLDLEGTVYTNSGTNYYACSPVFTTGTLTIIPTIPEANIAIYSNGVFQFMTTTNKYGVIAADLTGLTNVTVGLPINSKIVSHPIDVGGKTKSVMKRIGKVQISVHDTAAGAITINGKTGYMNPRTDHICFYGVTGMKDEIKYTITNNNGAMFHLESLLMNIEYGTLDS